MEPIEQNTQEQITKTINIKRKVIQPVASIDPILELKKRMQPYKESNKKKTKGNNIDVYV